MGNLVRAVVVSAVLFAGAWSAQEAGAEPAAPLDLELSVAAPRVAAGDPVELTATVTNRGGEPCRLAALADGTVEVTSVTRDGSPVAPEFVQAMYEVSLPAQWAGSAREVAPGAGVSFPLATGRQVAAISVLPGGNGVGSRWSFDRPGRYEISAAYRMPFLDGACVGSTGPAAVEVVVGAPETDPPVNWWVVGGLAGVGVLLLSLLVVLVWRRRRAATVVVPALLAATMVVGSWHAAPATADDADFRKELQTCMGKLDKVDPAGIMYFFRDTSKAVRIEFKPTTGSSLTTGTDKSLTVVWNPYNKKDFPGDPGVARDPCSSLYHELVHAFDIAQGSEVSSPCAKISQDDEQTPPSVGDVRAIRAENAVRRALGEGAGGKRPRTNHGKDAMGRVERLPGRQAPAKGQKPGDPWDPDEVSKDCEVPEPQSPQGPRTAHETAGGTDGDPHVTTFDQRRYDFQAVGEFVLAESGDVEVHVRQAPVDGSRLVSVNTALGIRVGTDRLTFAMHSDGVRVTLNGEPATFRTADSPLPGGGSVTPHGTETTISWPDGTEADVLPIGYWGMRVLLYPAAAHKGRFTGLLGDFDGNPGNDLSTADGTALPEFPDHDQLYGGFADRWRVTQGESLLPYPDGKDTASYTDTTFPDEVTTVADLDAGARAAAHGICAALGITEAARRRDCVLDLALTGRPAFAASAATTEHLVSATERGVSSSTPEPPAGENSSPGGVLRDADHADAVIGKAGETHTYRLDLGDATVFRLHDITGDVGRSGNGSLRIDLAGPGGEASPGFTVTSNHQYRVLKGGDYTLTVSRVDNDTGEYGFRLVTAKERRVHARFGDRITGRLTEPGSVDLYVLTATESTEVHLAEGTGCDVEVAIVEESPAPHVYSPSRPCWEITLVKTEPGKRYLLIVWSGVAATGDYSFRIATTR